MNILLLNWQLGENDPFSAFNAELRKHFEEYECAVSTLAFDSDFLRNIQDLNAVTSFDCALTFQGIGSSVGIGSGLIWEALKVRLFCLHGDHPSLVPQHHAVDSKFVSHLYRNMQFAKYASENFPRKFPVYLLRQPNPFRSRHTMAIRGGEYFVLPKNLDPLEETYEAWRTKLPGWISEGLITVSEMILENFKLGDPLEHHEVIDLFYHPVELERIGNFLKKDLKTVKHMIHATLDTVYRNGVAEFVLAELRDFPLRVYGRGWDKLKVTKSPKHSFHAYGSVADGDFQFYSSFGIIDITPNRDSSHDRTFRAMAHGGGFLSNSQFHREEYEDTNAEFDGLFYSGRPGDLIRKVERVISNPGLHIERCREFSLHRGKLEPFKKFIDFLRNSGN